jgi:hypothetical protein
MDPSSDAHVCCNIASLLDGQQRGYDRSVMSRYAIASLITAGACGLAPAVARATPAGASSVYVLSLVTDDSDDQADALTQALRSQVRATPGWTLLETQQSFETLAIALKCPAKPDAPCLQRIGDQLHANQYIWGSVARQGPGHLEVAVHLWIRGKSPTDASESFGETLKDASEGPVRAMATRLFEQLTGTHATGTIVVHAGAGAGTGTVWVDGVEREPLVAGSARLSVPAGEHTVAVRVPGSRAPAQATTVSGGDERTLEFSLAPIAPPPTASGVAPAPAQATSEPMPPPVTTGTNHTRAIIGYTAIAAGAGFLVGAGVEGARWLSDKNASDKDRAAVPSSVTDVCNYRSPPAIDACNKSSDAKNVSTLGWVFAAAGVVLAGTGTWLVVADANRGETTLERSQTARRARLEVIPSVSARAQSLDLRVHF